MSSSFYDQEIFDADTLTVAQREVVQAKLANVSQDMQWLRQRMGDMDIRMAEADKASHPDVAAFYRSQKEVYRIMLEGYERWHNLTLTQLADQPEHRPAFRPAH